MHDIVSSGKRFSHHFDGKPATDQVIAGCAVSFRQYTQNAGYERSSLRGSPFPCGVSKLFPNTNAIFGLHPNKMLWTTVSPMHSWRQEQFAA